MHSFKTGLDPWCLRLLAIVAAAPLLQCGGRSEHDGRGADGSAGKSSGGSGWGGSGGTGAGSGSGSGNFGGSSVSGAAAAGGTTGGAFACENPTPLDPEWDTGFVQCDGFKHRPEIASCKSSLPRPDAWPLMDGDTCERDTECTERPHGYCQHSGGLGGSRACRYGCTTDAECGENSVCVCGEFIGTCLISSCKVDADCGPGLLCATHQHEFCGDSGFACQRPEDECAWQGDCSKGRCELDRNGVRRCIEGGCAVVGRPFLVGESARVARAEPRADWISDEVEHDARKLTAEERSALGAAWLRNALMEHASVAAFARFTLELLAVGAPADLVRDSNAAASDETRHAELCFALASEYLGEPVGPGALCVDGALGDLSLERLVVTAIHEGCIGETVAAVEAAEQLAHAKDPAVRRVLALISEDETRHAELAWRFVKWALEREPSLHGAVEREFEGALSMPRPLVGAEALDLTRHGVLTERARAELRGAVLERVISEAASALVGKASLPRRSAAPVLSA